MLRFRFPFVFGVPVAPAAAPPAAAPRWTKLSPDAITWRALAAPLRRFNRLYAQEPDIKFTKVTTDAEH